MTSRVYTQEQYDDATERISKLIELDTIKSIDELDRKLKKNDVYIDVRGGKGTIYEQLLTNYRTFIRPKNLIEQEQKIQLARKKPLYSKRVTRAQRREIIKIEGISYFRQENKIVIRKVGGEVRQYIVHQGRLHRLDNIIVYQRTYKTKTKLFNKWHTRRKPKRSVKSAKKQ